MRSSLRRLRGNALLITIIALAVLMVLVVGAIRFTGTNREGAAAKLRGDKNEACAEVARRYLMSRLSIYSAPSLGTSGSLTLVDSANPAERSVISSGHYSGVDGGPGVALVPNNQFSWAKQEVDDTANTLKNSGLGYGQTYRVTVKCSEPNNLRESEVEFVFRYGGT
jgi:hypothetical protein